MKTEAIPNKTEFKFNCPTCGQHILVATQWSGLGISCPSCQSRITIPPPPSDERIAQPLTAPNHTGRTIRIELPHKPNNAAGELNGYAPAASPASAAAPNEARMKVPPTTRGNEPWPDLVRKLEKGASVRPAELATALFHELTVVRRRLDRLENQMTRKTTDGNEGLPVGSNHDSVPERAT